ncbi:hypothetical protein D3C87_1294930 [compost metagenome]
MSGFFASASFSNCAICRLVSAIELFCGRFQSTISSTRSEAGKNCCCTRLMPPTERANNATVRMIVTQRKRSARDRSQEKPEAKRPFFSWCDFIALGNIATPSSGVNTTATIHDTISETAITTNRVNVNSPAALLLRPTGMKPATVTSVPVSIGNAVEV